MSRCTWLVLIAAEFRTSCESNRGPAAQPVNSGEPGASPLQYTGLVAVSLGKSQIASWPGGDARRATPDGGHGEFGKCQVAELTCGAREARSAAARHDDTHLPGVAHGRAARRQCGRVEDRHGLGQNRPEVHAHSRLEVASGK